MHKYIFLQKYPNTNIKKKKQINKKILVNCKDDLLKMKIESTTKRTIMCVKGEDRHFLSKKNFELVLITLAPLPLRLAFSG